MYIDNKYLRGYRCLTPSTCNNSVHYQKLAAENFGKNRKLMHFRHRELILRLIYVSKKNFYRFLKCTTFCSELTKSNG